MSETSGKGKEIFKIYGLPWYLTLAAIIIILGTVYTGVLGTNIPCSIAVILAFGAIFYEIGERLPIWNSYIGGGVLAAFFGTAILAQFKLVPQKYIESIDFFISGKMSFLNFFIVLLITGSVLGLNKKVLMKSFSGYVPAILGGLFCAIALGVMAGMIFGIRPADVIIKYALPIMGGGNGAGAVPLSQIYEQATGDAAVNYYTFAIIILTIANIMSIIAGGLLNKLGDVKTNWTGDKKTLLRNAANIAGEEKLGEPTLPDIGGALMVGVTSYACGLLFSKFLLPTIFGAQIHEFAYMIIFVVILAATGVVPDEIRAGAKRLQKFMTTCCSVIVMAGLGFDFNLAELVAASSIPNVIISLFVVIGAIIGSAVVGQMVGFYPIDSAITAGLCMANRGGNGDIAVLGAAKRMDLMAYAQLSSRLGGGIVLIVAGFLFSFLL
ncbi:2-hydroxycarboxylate transporter family protein [Fusobacterium sp. PH5-44]|uniref:2-hydroxycarboxylate transporter family protein n=1 Tax=unclassified Fusobacterium TaxID=2648384 RepID=UPI003D2252FA